MAHCGALGCVAYWLLTGRLVFETASYQGMLVAHATAEPPLPSRHAEQPVPEDLDAIVLACLAKEPDHRVQSAEELADRLSAVALSAPWAGDQAAEWWRLHMPTNTELSVPASATR